jgi:hypothetical protein
MVRKYIFMSVGQAISYFNNKNPARARSVNLLEPEFGNKQSAEHFSGNHPDDIYASVCHAIQRVLDMYGDRQVTRIFKLHWIGSREGCLAKEEIAKVEHMSVNRVRRILRDISSELEMELARRELMPNPEDFDKNLH